ncbi:hypothetical protein QTO34_002836 [Cnephaeus nilssonii]|uniref:Uncharacterized protein n=1 Tax=Cnephaeus nilssonii TaxID=3371016 RepID=A0AA40HTT8_CNENI|nr:hypothetical protein QTO34_002836 [Eptesicus nilssonii]
MRCGAQGKMRMQTFRKVGKRATKGLKQKAFPSKHLVADQPEQGSQWYMRPQWLPPLLCVLLL